MSQKESTTMEDIETTELILIGRSKLAKNEIPDALEHLQTACHRMSKEHGEMSEKLVDVYMYYGCALLAMSRVESGVLGNALSGIIDKAEENNMDLDCDEVEKKDDGDKAWEEISEKVIDAMVEKDDLVETEEISVTEEKDEEEKPEETEKVDEPVTEETKKEDEESEDVSHLQLSWEILDLTRKIIEKQENKEMDSKLAKVYLLLGEVSVETGSYDQGVDDFKKCLDIRENLESSTSRLLAEVNYQIGIAYSYAKNYDESLKYLNVSIEIMNKDIEILSKNGSENTEEISDIRMVLPQMMQRIKDVEEERDDKSNNNKEKNGVTPDNTEADDISHMLKKKRETDSDIQPKKMKMDSSAIEGEGDHIANGNNAMKA
ncbi:CENP-A escort protein sim3 [Intoshia linei]|uniref:CENP-A escort protein sim3 n=1 Tax=Intoshia linei TaxID=1819745 RepID=A0A177B1I0_9BILA|nr:CENP-A escort protein sim3 [Intoshia linei]